MLYFDTDLDSPGHNGYAHGNASQCMGDTKDGRDKKGLNEDRRQREHELARAREYEEEAEHEGEQPTTEREGHEETGREGEASTDE